MALFLNIIKFITLILCVGFFTSSETAYLSLTNLKVRRLQEEKKKGSKTVAKLKENLDQLLTTVLIGTNYLNSLTSALATALALSVLGNSKFATLSPFITAFFITTFGQIIPKTIAGLYPDKIACLFSKPLRILEIAIFPIVWLFGKVSGAVVSIAEKVMKISDPIITEEELKTLIAVGENEGTIEKTESKMMNRLIKFNDMQVSDVMKHKNFVRMLKSDDSFEVVIANFQKYGYSIMPVYKDTPENIIGMIDYKNVLYADGNPSAEKLMQPITYVPETFSVLEMLNKFRQEEYRFAVVLSERGQTMGIITIEDIIRVVFGRMTTEENLYNELAPEEKIKIVSPNAVLIPGEMKIDEVNDLLGISVYSENFSTIGGWVLENFGHLPVPGEIMIYKTLIFQIEDINQRRISVLRVIRN